MLWTIAKREFLENILNKRFLIATVLCLVLIPLSFYLSLQDYRRKLENYSISLRKQELFSGLVGTYRWSSGAVMKRGRSVEPGGQVKRPAVLSIFAKGCDDKLSGPFELQGRWLQPFFGRSQEPNPLFAIYPTPDYLFVVEVVMSLLALLFAFDSIAGERTQGTLQLALSNPIPRDVFLLGKLLGGYAGLALPFLAATLFSLAFLSLSPTVVLSEGDWARIALIVLISLVYIFIFYLLGLLISSRSQSPSKALLLSLFLWVLLVPVGPSLGALMARAIRPVMSAEQAAARRYDWAKRRIEEAQKIYRSPDTGEYELPIHHEIDWEIAQHLDRIDQLRRRQQGRLVSLTKYIERITPVGALVFAVTSLAGTSVDDLLRYKDEAMRAKRDKMEEVYLPWSEAEKLLRKRGYTEEEIAKLKRRMHITSDTKRILVKEPGQVSFSLREKTLGESLNQALPDFGVLLCFAVGLFLCVHLSFLRADIG